MNDFTKYKIKKVVEKGIDKLLTFVFYPTRKMYKDCEWFRKWIQDREYSKARKKRKKRCLERIIYDLNSQDKCVVYTHSSPDDECCYFDRAGWDYETLLESDEWIEKNKLDVEKITLYDYVKRENSNRLYRVDDWEKENIVIVIRRKNEAEKTIS